MTRSARSTWNFLTVIAFSAVSMGVALVVTPILLRTLGEARLGASRAIIDWAGYLMLLELGLGGAMLPLLARELARKSTTGVRGVLAAGFRAYVRVTGLMILGGLLLAAIITRILKIDPIYHHDLRVATLIAIVPLVLMPLSPLRLLIEASQRGYIINLLMFAQTLSIAGGAVLFAKLGWGITGQSLAIVIGTMSFALMFAIDSIYRCRRYLPSLREPAPPEARAELWRLNTPTLILNACGRVGLLTDNIIVGSILSAGMIVPFYITQRLATLTLGQLQSIGSASWAGLAELHATDQHDLFRARFLELNKLIAMIGLIVLAPIVAYNHAFVRLWVGEEQYVGMSLTTISAVNALVLSLASLWGWIFAGTGQIARLVPVGIASATINLVVSVCVTWLFRHNPHAAILGPVLGTSFAYALVNLPITPMLLRRHYGISVRGLLGAVCVPLVLGVPYCAALIWIAHRYTPTTWLSLAIQMSAAALLCGILCWLLLLKREDRDRWRVRFRLALGRGQTAKEFEVVQPHESVNG